jgi:hypothetical protein
VAATANDDLLPARNIRHDYIWANLRREWIDFYEWRWTGFFKKVCDAVHAIGKEVWVLGMYCTDPFDTRYIYGFDSKLFGGNGFVYYDGWFGRVDVGLRVVLGAWLEYRYVRNGVARGYECRYKRKAYVYCALVV